MKLCCLVSKCYHEYMHTRSIIWTEKAIFRNIVVYTYRCIHSITINERRGQEFGEGYTRGMEKVKRKNK